MKLLSLEKNPIVESTLEIRYNQGIPELIVAGLMNIYKGQIKNGLEKLPVNQIPEIVRKADPNLQHVPLYRLSLNELVLQVGNDTLSIIKTIPYSNWIFFENAIRELLNNLGNLNIAETTRLGLRYLNFIEENVMDVCNLSLNEKIKFERKQINCTEIYNNNGLFVKTQIATGAKLNLNDSVKDGSIIDIDVYQDEKIKTSEVSAIAAEINQMHNVEKDAFISILRKEYLDKLGAKYSE